MLYMYILMFFMKILQSCFSFGLCFAAFACIRNEEKMVLHTCLAELFLMGTKNTERILIEFVGNDRPIYCTLYSVQHQNLLKRKKIKYNTGTPA